MSTISADWMPEISLTQLGRRPNLSVGSSPSPPSIRLNFDNNRGFLTHFVIMAIGQ